MVAASGNGKPQNGTPDEASWESFPASDPPAPGSRMEAEGDPNPHPGPPTAVARPIRRTLSSGPRTGRSSSSATAPS